MKPIDPRLLKYAVETRWVLGLGSLLALLKTLSLIVWVFSLANLIVILVAPVMTFENGSSGKALTGLYDSFGLREWFLLATVALSIRAISSWAIDALAASGGIQVKARLRQLALKNLDSLGPGWFADKSGVDITLRLTRGLDALDKYFGQFFPQLILTVVTTPILMIVLFIADPLSGTIVLIVFPLMPIFMVLIGIATKGAQDKQWRGLQTLSAAYMSVLQGIETLKIFRLEKPQIRRVKEITEDYRQRTMKVLRVTFISGFVLDLGATLSVAIVAVTIGTRLVEGSFSLVTGLFILLLLPETFIAVRNVGAAFHASGEGISAAEDVFEIVEAERSALPKIIEPENGELLRVTNLSVLRGQRAINEPLTFWVKPGEMVALIGESGAGKSSILMSVMGFEAASTKIRRAKRFAYMRQRPALNTGSVLENVTLGDADPDRVLATSILDELQVNIALNAPGKETSGGQAQRIALARALYFAQKTGAKLLLLDEPTSQVDAETEQAVYSALEKRLADGYGILCVTHSEWLASKTDRIVRLKPGLNPPKQSRPAHPAEPLGVSE